MGQNSASSRTGDGVGVGVDGGRAKRDYSEPSLATNTDTAHVVPSTGENNMLFQGLQVAGGSAEKGHYGFL